MIELRWVWGPHKRKLILQSRSRSFEQGDLGYVRFVGDWGEWTNVPVVDPVDTGEEVIHCSRRAEIATAIADDLMENGAGEVAQRLVMMVGGKDRGGWSRLALGNRVEKLLKENGV